MRFNRNERMTMLDTLAITPSTERRSPAARDVLLQRVSAEFQEMPCMRLTAGQARLLFGLRPDVCERILEGLVRRGSLCSDGERYRLNDFRTWPVHDEAVNHNLVRARAS